MIDKITKAYAILAGLELGIAMLAIQRGIKTYVIIMALAMCCGMAVFALLLQKKSYIT